MLSNSSLPSFYFNNHTSLFLIFTTLHFCIFTLLPGCFLEFLPFRQVVHHILTSKGSGPFSPFTAQVQILAKLVLKNIPSNRVTGIRECFNTLNFYIKISARKKKLIWRLLLLLYLVCFYFILLYSSIGYLRGGLFPETLALFVYLHIIKFLLHF